MRESLRFTTEESSVEVLTGLIADLDSLYSCNIKVPIRHEDAVEMGSRPLFVERLHGRTVSYEVANGDRAYRTNASFEPGGETFVVDIIIHSRLADLMGATIAMSSTALEVFERLNGKDSK